MVAKLNVIPIYIILVDRGSVSIAFKKFCNQNNTSIGDWIVNGEAMSEIKEKVPLGAMFAFFNRFCLQLEAGWLCVHRDVMPKE